MVSKFTQTKFVQLMSDVTGHTKNFVKERTELRNTSPTSFRYKFNVGHFKYESWVVKEKYIYTQFFHRNTCAGAFYNDLDTLAPNLDKDFESEQEKMREFERSIKEQYREELEEKNLIKRVY